MNWDAIGAVAEVFGALAVLASLIYLAIQIRHNSASVDASTEDGVVSGFNDINLVIGADPEVARNFSKGLSTPEDLGEDETIQFFFLMSSFINQYSRLFILERTPNAGPSRHQSGSPDRHSDRGFSLSGSLRRY